MWLDYTLIIYCIVLFSILLGNIDESIGNAIERTSFDRIGFLSVDARKEDSPTTLDKPLYENSEMTNIASTSNSHDIKNRSLEEKLASSHEKSSIKPDTTTQEEEIVVADGQKKDKEVEVSENKLGKKGKQL